jgi:hypothetical protein
MDMDLHLVKIDEKHDNSSSTSGEVSVWVNMFFLSGFLTRTLQE